MPPASLPRASLPESDEERDTTLAVEPSESAATGRREKFTAKAKHVAHLIHNRFHPNQPQPQDADKDRQPQVRFASQPEGC